MVTDDPDKNPPHRSRLESEVLEILERTDTEPSPVIKFTSRAQRERKLRTQRLKHRLASLQFSSLEYLIGCVLFAILAVVLQHSSPLLGKLLAIGSIGCLIMVFVQSYRQPKQFPTKRWRGRDIDFRQSSDVDWKKFFRGPKGPRR